MIDEKLIDNVREHGTYSVNWQGKEKVLADIGYPKGCKADYAIIMGCAQPEAMPEAIGSLKILLDRLQISYTILGKEFCCGWLPFGQPAVMAKNEEDIARSKELSREFIVANIRQAEVLGAKAIVLFCAACEPSYSNLADETTLPIISYSALLEQYFPGGRLDMAIDYYPGCYRFRRRITEHVLDIEPARRILGKVQGLQVNEPDRNLCCFIPPHREKLNNSFASRDIVTICTGCYHNLRYMMIDKKEYHIWMLPEILLQAFPG